MSDGKTGLQLRSLLKKSGELELSLASVPTPEPAKMRSWSVSRRRRSTRPISGPDWPGGHVDRARFGHQGPARGHGKDAEAAMRMDGGAARSVAAGWHEGAGVVIEQDRRMPPRR